MPPDIPDWQFPYSEIAEEEKELPRKGKRRSKSRGEDLKHSISGIDRTIPKLQQVDTAKAGERIRRKSQDISAAPHVKEIKHKKKGTSQLEAREGTHDQEKVTFSDSTSRLSVKKADGKPELVKKYMILFIKALTMNFDAALLTTIQHIYASLPQDKYSKLFV